MTDKTKAASFDKFIDDAVFAGDNTKIAALQLVSIYESMESDMKEHNYADMPNTKTIMDAVIEFEGEFNTEHEINHNDERLILLCIQSNELAKKGTLRFGQTQYHEDYYISVCSENEFNALVSELETNFGKSTQTYVEYKAAYHFKDLDYDKINEELNSMVDKEQQDNKVENKKELNPHILLVMKWLNDKDSVTKEELASNRNAAYAAAAYAASAYAAAYAASAASAAAYAASAASAAADAEKWTGKYFERTKENKQDYVDALKQNDFGAIHDDKQVFTQAMSDNEELPSVGMECLIEVGGKGSWTEFTPHYFGEKYVVGYWKANDREAAFAIDALKFKPLAPIDLDNGEAYQFNYKDLCLNETIKLTGIYDKPQHILSTLTRNCKVIDCTNIVKLVPENKPD